jgi:putative ABC transport system ATP-binding protein
VCSSDLIITTGIGKVYRSDGQILEVLKGINLTVSPNEFVAIMGPSGSGKTTLLNILGCLDTPTEGSYILDGQEVSRLDENCLAAIRSRKIGFIFQSFNLIPRMTALENVRLPLLYQKGSSSAATARALEVLTKVGLRERASHWPSKLSGGELQRVAIARALVASPKIILADEPTGNLDSASGKDIMTTLQNLNREGATIILVTHDRVNAAYASKIFHIIDGAICSVEEVAKRSPQDK